MQIVILQWMEHWLKDSTSLNSLITIQKHNDDNTAQLQFTITGTDIDGNAKLKLNYWC